MRPFSSTTWLPQRPFFSPAGHRELTARRPAHMTFPHPGMPVLHSCGNAASCPDLIDADCLQPLEVKCMESELKRMATIWPYGGIDASYGRPGPARHRRRDRPQDPRWPRWWRLYLPFDHSVPNNVSCPASACSSCNAAGIRFEDTLWRIICNQDCLIGGSTSFGVSTCWTLSRCRGAAARWC